MENPASIIGKPCVLIDASQEGVLRFATASSTARGPISNIHEIDIEGVPTLTDAIQQFARQNGTQLYGLDCCMAVAGTTSGDTLSLVRSRWTIARTGLAALFGKPVTIINDVVARAWGLQAGDAAFKALRGSGMPDLRCCGRYIILNVEEGVGAAVMDVDDYGKTRILGTEAGDMDFAATSESEWKLVSSTRGLAQHATWERLLMLEPEAPEWSVCPDISLPARSAFLAALLGRFCINLMHACGAWDGLLITGTRGARLLVDNRHAFDTAFAGRYKFRRLVTCARAWEIKQQEAVLTGAAECLRAASSIS